jgi:hypothetical protein
MKRATMFLVVGLILLAAAMPAIRAGAQQTVVNDENLDEMIVNAKTPAEHEAIAAYFDQEAAAAKKKAELHRKAAETYRKLKISKPVYMAEMCDSIAAGFDAGAADAEKMATMHREMAKNAGAATAH